MSRISPSLLEGAVTADTPMAGAARKPVLQSVRTEGTVHGLLLEMIVEQVYHNSGAANVEVAYSFPLPHDAVLLGLEFELGERKLQGNVVARADAEEQYEEAIESGDTAVMLERAADGIYTANVGNLLAHEQAVVRLRYAQLLSFRQGQVCVTVPNVIAPRFGDPSTACLRLHQIPTHDLRVSYPFSLSMRLHGPVACGRISSPSHALAVRHAGGHFEIGLAQPQSAMLDRDFVLLCDGVVGKSIATIGRDGTGYVALASFCPAPDTGPALPLNLKILVDCSGSMNGDSMQGARKALHEILAQLNPTDRFSYSRFGTQVAHHSNTLMSATARAVLEGSNWIAQTAAVMGGTELRQALLSTFALGQPTQADVLLITDGDIWDTEPVVAAASKAGQRVFAVGVGAAPATSLLQRLAASTGGACELIGANDDVCAAVLRMFMRMRQAPVSDVQVTWEGQCAWQSEPGKVVFSGETVHAMAGFENAAPANALLAWSDADGSAQQQTMRLDESVADGDTLARVAAAMRLPALPAEQRHALSLRYQLVSDSTSLLIVHQRTADQRADVLPRLRTVPQMWVAGHSGIGSVPHLASPAVWRRETTSEQIQAMMRNGVESYDTPAFLRRGHDIAPFLYRDQLRVFLEQYVSVTHGGDAPVTFAEVEGALPGIVFQELCDIAELGYAPQEVLRRFIVALHRCFYPSSLPRRVLEGIKKLGATAEPRDTLDRRVSEMTTRTYDARHIQPDVYDIPAFLRKQAD